MMTSMMKDCLYCASTRRCAHDFSKAQAPHSGKKKKEINVVSLSNAHFAHECRMCLTDDECSALANTCDILCFFPQQIVHTPPRRGTAAYNTHTHDRNYSKSPSAPSIKKGGKAVLARLFTIFCHFFFLVMSCCAKRLSPIHIHHGPPNLRVAGASDGK